MIIGITAQSQPCLNKGSAGGGGVRLWACQRPIRIDLERQPKGMWRLTSENQVGTSKSRWKQRMRVTAKCVSEAGKGNPLRLTQCPMRRVGDTGRLSSDYRPANEVLSRLHALDYMRRTFAWKEY